MATSQLHARPVSRSFLSVLSEFAGNASTLEKSLRLAHALSWSLIALSRPQPDPGLVTARTHLAVSRRFFRLLKWVDSWSAATLCFGELRTTPSASGTLAFAKHTLLALYFFTEMLALPHAIGLSGLLAAKGPRLQIEADRFWLYALLVSILLGCLELATLQLVSVSSPVDDVPLTPAVPPTKRGRGRPRKYDGGGADDAQQGDGEAESSSLSSPTSPEPVKRGRGRPRKGTKSSPATDDGADDTSQKSFPSAQEKRRQLVKGIVVDACDTLIPAWSIGLAPLGELGVGMCMSLSTLIPLGNMWSAVRLEGRT